MSIQSLRGQHLWILLIPAGLSFLFMAPRIASAQFGLFDDAVTLQTGERILVGDLSAAIEAENGRLRPLYWIYYAVLQGIAGLSPGAFFVGNAVLLFLITLLLGWIAFSISRSLLLAVVAQVLLLLSGPVVENAYTLSKPELLQAMWLLLSVALVVALASTGTRRREMILVALSSLCFLSAGLTKETAPVMVAVAAGWVARAWAFRRAGAAPEAGTMRRRNLYLFAAVIGAALTLALQSVAGSIATIQNASAFGRPDLGLLRTNANIWVDMLLRDYLYLGVLVSPAMAIAFLSRRWRDLGLQLDALIWMAMWLAIYLPWQSTPEYYLLPFALGAALMGAISVGVLVEWAAGGGRVRRAGAAAVVVLAGVSFVPTLPNNLTNARVQLAMDKANGTLLEHLARALPEGAVLIVNIQEPNEFVGMIPLWINDLLDRPDITVDYFHFQDLKANGAGRPVFVASPHVENQFYPSVRLGVHESASNAWSASLSDHFGEDLTPTYETWERFRSLAIDTSCLFNDLLGRYAFCQRPDMPIDTRRFGFGWVVYSLDLSPD